MSEVEKYVATMNLDFVLSGQFVIVSWPNGHKKLCSVTEYIALTSQDLLDVRVELPGRVR